MTHTRKSGRDMSDTLNRGTIFVSLLAILTLTGAADSRPPAQTARGETTKPAATVSPSLSRDASGSERSVMATPYPFGNPTLKELYVSPSGRDSNSGLTQSAPLKTLTAAWGKIPAGATLTGTGYRINILPGTYPCEPAEPDDCQNYFADRLGTAQLLIGGRPFSQAELAKSLG